MLSRFTAFPVRLFRYLPGLVVRTGTFVAVDLIRHLVAPGQPGPNGQLGSEMGKPFLSPAWIAAARAVADEYVERFSGAHLPPLQVNVEVTAAPSEVAEEGVVRAHADTRFGALLLDVGAVAEPDLTISVDYGTAYDLLVAQRPDVALGAFLSGRMKISGDVERLTATTGFDPANIPGLFSALGVGGSSTLAGLDPTATEIGERIRALTA